MFPLFVSIWPQSGFWLSAPVWLLVVLRSPTAPQLYYSQSASEKGRRTVPSVGAGIDTSLSFPFQSHLGLPRGAEAALGVHRGALCSRLREAGGESVGRRWLRVLRARRGANPRLRGRRPRPWAGPSACPGEGSGRAPPAAAEQSAAAEHSAASAHRSCSRGAWRRCRSAQRAGSCGTATAQQPPRISRRGSPAASRRARVPECCQREDDEEAEWRPAR